ncbi:hypothetical protein [Nitrosomonas sp. Nm58]|jgi:hypothetical protein|uniref:hypothetical protein n=1 Tax=Nitrosomonas sp. Nm58 TaxID=200126 RepID=UPI0008988CFF|nr:hypothetical protein [Nitrosomonas sp. Nm58]SDY38715.1 hypothetical protein SAMN05421754_100853 [Nitrosomonas sp. Nm58]
MESQEQRELPRYKGHKEVCALKIKKVIRNQQSFAITLSFEEEGYSDLAVSEEWLIRHRPQAGGYYVVCQDGYVSYSSAKAFEDGYTLIRPVGPLGVV